jgi:glucose dehydrogenase
VKKIFERLDQVTLDQITKDNFKNLQITGSYSTGLGGSTEKEQFA